MAFTVYFSIVYSIMKVTVSSYSNTLDSTHYQALTQRTKMPYHLSDQTATTYYTYADSDGPRIYITGGCIQNQICNVNSTTHAQSCHCPAVTNNVIYYTPQTDTYHHCASMVINRTRHVAALVGNYLYAVGGRNVNDTIIHSIERYDIVNDVWTVVVPQYNYATSDAVMFSYLDRYLYVIGGYDKFYNSTNYNIEIDTLNMYSTTFRSPLPTPRGDARIGKVNGIEYVIGGFSSQAPWKFCKPMNTVEGYDPSQNQWREERGMKYDRGDMAVAVLGGFVFAIAGESVGDPNATCTQLVPVANTGRYNPANNSWVTEQSIPDDRFRYEAASYNNTQSGAFAIFLFGGQTTFDSDTLTYNLLDTTIQYIPAVFYDGQSDSGLSDGAIAGIVVGVVVGICALAVIFLLILAYRRQRFYKRNDMIQSPDEMARMETIQFDDDTTVYKIKPSHDV